MKFASFFLLIIISFFSFSQNFEFKSFSIAEGLPQSQVCDITEDHNGNLWLATKGGGVAKFDGYRFKTFTTKDGLVNNFASSIFHDSKKNIWIGTSNGISLYNGIRFRNFKLEEDSLKISISAIAENKYQELFFGTNNGIYKRVKKKNLNISKEIGLPDKSILDVFVDSLNHLWIAHNKGFSRYKNGNMIHFTDDVLKSVYPQCFSEGSFQTIWVGTYGRGLVKVRGQKYKLIPKTDGLIVLDIYKEGDFLWLSTLKNGILLYNIKENRIRPIQNYKNLPTLNCRKVLKDSWGGKWIGTYDSGLLKYSQPEIKGFNLAQGLVGKSIYSVASSSDSGVWVSTNARKLFKVTNGELEEYGLNQNIYPLKIKTILEDTQGRLWLGTDGNGIMLWNKGLTKRLVEGNHLMSGFVKDIIEDKKGNIWVATSYGLTRFTKDLSVFHYSTEKNNIHFNGLSCLHVDRSDRIWYGTNGGGLGVISDSGHTIVNHKGRLSNIIIRDLTEDGLGNLFIATDDLGVLSVNIYSDNFVVKNITKKDGQKFNNINSVFCDEKNELWLGGTKGVNRVIKPLRNEKEIIFYGLLEGFTGLENNQGAVCSDLNQNIWWGTVNGMMKKASFDLTRNRYPPKISLSSVNLFYKNIQGTQYEPNIYNWYSAEDLVFKFEDNHIGFKLEGHDLSQPGGIRYMWRLDGGDGRWSPLVEQNEVFFSNLSPGRYIFQAKAVNKDGIQSEILEFYFSVSSPYYYKLWFWLLIITLLVAITYWAVKKRILEIRLKANEQSEKLRLEKEVLELEQKALRLQMNPHFIFNALNAIQDQIRIENNKGARHSLSKFSKLMRQILDSSRMNYISLELELNILENYLSIEKLTRDNSFEYSIKLDSQIDSEEEGIPPMIIQPFLENSIIHGIAGRESIGKINISFSIDDEFLWVEIEDNGVGIEKSKELKSQQYQQHKSVALEVIQSRLQNLSNGQNSSSFRMEDRVEDGKVLGAVVKLKLKRKVFW
ncbi:MAG: hypothetical protein CMD18_08660 [Flavobacteriales bacterium]|nr:hypothetical protein [Flavobacteriales bacterium]